MKLAGFIRGINVGGHHKVPMAELRARLTDLGCTNVKTLLNSGNFVCDTAETNIQDIENKLEQALTQAFGFPMPVQLRAQKEITDLVERNPFAAIAMHEAIRLYVSFLKTTPETQLPVPYISADKSYIIISVQDKSILSVLDLTATSTPKGMDDLEKLFGKNITTRNWNTVVKVAKL